MTLARAASGEPSASSAWGHAWRPMSSLSLPGLAAGLQEICHRRSRRHPACSPRLLRPSSGLRLAVFRCLAVRVRRGFRPFTVHKSRGLGAFAVSVALPIGQVLGLSGNFASLRPMGPTCLWPKPPASRLQIGAWTDVTAIFGIKTSGSSRPCGYPIRLLRVPKTGSKCA